MATPHVSGVAALLLADNPQATYASIKARLISHSRPLAAMDGLVASGGIVDAYYALTGLRPPADPNDPSNWTGRKHASFSTQHPYQDNSKVRFTIREPGAKRIAVRFGKFDTESIYDSVQFFDSSGESLGSMSGSQDGRFSPIADGDTIILEFATDESITSYGFDVEHVFFEP
jgi:hypothetical protein